MKSRICNNLGKASILFMLVSFGLILSSCDKDDDSLPDGVTRIYVKEMPKVAYALDAPIDLNGLLLAIERGEDVTDVPFANFEKEGITVDPPHGTILRFDHHSLTITHKPSGRGIVQAIDVTNKISTLTVNVAPVTEYEVADTLNLSSLVVNLVKENGESRAVPYIENKDDFICVPAHGDTLNEAASKVVVTYLPTNVKMEIPIQVNPFRPKSVMIKSRPAKDKYDLGEALQLDGLILEYEMSSGAKIQVPFNKFIYYGINTSVGNNDVIGKNDNSIGIVHEASSIAINLNIEVNTVLNVKSIAVKSLPDVLFYKVGELINLDGLLITLTRDDNVKLDIPYKYFSKVDISTSVSSGTPFVKAISNVIITHVGSGLSVRSPLKVAIRAASLNVKIPQVSPNKWAIMNFFDKDVMPYSDRVYRIATFPNELRGLQWIQTTMDLIYFTEDQVAEMILPDAYTIYFVHCNGNTVPAWLAANGWIKTTMAITFDNRLPFSIFKKDFEANEAVKLYKFANTSASKAPPYFLILERR